MLLRSEGIDRFPAFLRGLRRRVVGLPPIPPRRDLPVARPAAKASAPAAQTTSPVISKTRSALGDRVECQRLAALQVRNLAAGRYAYRWLKNGFDDAVIELGIDPKSVSDKRFALWLQELGCTRRRIKRENTTMYDVPGIAPATRSNKRAKAA